MNDNFINIKVDREERPDLDFIFQKKSRDINWCSRRLAVINVFR